MADQLPPDPDTSPHPLVSKLVDEQGKPRPFVVLQGYFGKSPKKGLVRLYVGLDFSAFYELDPNDVLHTEKPDPNDANCPTRAYVNAAAKVSLVKTGGKLGDVVATGAAAYLQGAIAGSYLAGAQAAYAGSPHGGPIVLVSVPGPCPHSLGHVCQPAYDVGARNPGAPRLLPASIIPTQCCVSLGHICAGPLQTPLVSIIPILCPISLGHLCTAFCTVTIYTLEGCL
jgi:hypothetical protein